MQGKGSLLKPYGTEARIPAADSFLFWNADDVRAIRDRHEVLSVPFQVLAAKEATGDCYGPLPQAEVTVRPALSTLGPTPAAFLFLALAVTSDTSLGFRFRLEFGWISDKRKGRPAARGIAVAASPAEPMASRAGCRSRPTLSGMRVWFGR